MAKLSYEEQYKKMTQTPIPRLVLGLGFSTTVSMLVTTIYNMADTYFVSGIHISASGATGVVFALMNIIQALAYWLGHGAGSNLSQLLGAGEIERARKMSATAFYMGIGIALCVMTFGIIFRTPLMYLLGSTESILPYARDYSLYILIGAPGMISSQVLSLILRYEGRVFYGMIGLGTGGVLNIFGDYLLIRVYGMGISGAGIATCISQYIGMIILLAPFIRRQIQSSVNIKYFTLEKKLISRIFAVGFPSFTRQGFRSLSDLALNHSAAFVGGDPAIAAMSIVGRIANVMFCVCVGVGQGFQPVSGFNYGAKHYSRVRKAFFFTLCIDIFLMAVTGLFGFFNAETLVSLFRKEETVRAIGVLALQLRCAVLPFFSVSVCTNMLHQSTGQALIATILALTLGGGFFVPYVLIFSSAFGILGLQLAQPLADVSSFLISVPFIVRFMKKLPEDSPDV